MPLPTILAWLSHNFLADWLKVTNIFANITELGCVWLFFFPHRAVRKYIFYWQVLSKVYEIVPHKQNYEFWQMFLQFNVIITGNYGFLNFMLPILMLSLLNDQFLAEQSFKRWVYFQITKCNCNFKISRNQDIKHFIFRTVVLVTKVLVISYLLFFGIGLIFSSSIDGRE